MPVVQAVARNSAVRGTVVSEDGLRRLEHRSRLVPDENEAVVEGWAKPLLGLPSRQASPA